MFKSSSSNNGWATLFAFNHKNKLYEAMKIYTLAHPETNEVRYVGVTTVSTEERLRKHLISKENNRRTSWIKSILNHGLMPKIELIDDVDDSVWRDEERFYISYFRYLGFNLVNATEGGDGLSGYKRSQRTSDAQRAKMLGRKHREETIRKMSTRVGQYDTNWNLIREFDSVTQAAKNFGVTKCTISWAINRKTKYGKQRTAQGSYWKPL